jgi:NTE family protein
VLEVLDEQGLPVRGIVGTSMGAVIGAMYLAQGSGAAAIATWREAIDRKIVPPVRPVRRSRDSEEKEHPLIQVARRVRNHVVVAFAMHKSTVLDDEDMVSAFEFLVPELDFADLPCPFVAVATDLENGAEVRLDTGELRVALKASSAIPGLLPSVEVAGRPLVDGGVVADVPVAAARSIGWPVVAVDVSMDLPQLSEDDLVLDTMMRTQMMTARLLRRHHMRGATDVIRPEVGTTTWADWNRFDELVEAGRTATRRFLGSSQSSPNSRA